MVPWEDNHRAGSSWLKLVYYAIKRHLEILHFNLFSDTRGHNENWIIGQKCSLLRRQLSWYPHPKLYIIDKPFYCGVFLTPLHFVIFFDCLFLSTSICIFLLLFVVVVSSLTTLWIHITHSSYCLFPTFHFPLSSTRPSLCPFLRIITFGVVLWPILFRWAHVCDDWMVTIH